MKNHPLSKLSSFKSSLNQQGQLIVEYVILLVVATMIATMIRVALVKKDEENPKASGALLRRWGEVGTSIGKDDPNQHP
jgi:hypothetical protein